jgi:outer membrane protein insertion porin family
MNKGDRLSFRRREFWALAQSFLLVIACNSVKAAAVPMVASVLLRGTNQSVKLETQAGRPYDTSAIAHDVRRLWSTGRFNDVRVDKDETPAGPRIIFNVVEQPRLRLHQVVVEPSTREVKMSLPEGAPISPLAAHQLALQAQRELIAQGYVGARVDSALVPFARDEVDVRLHVRAGDVPVRVTGVQFVGEPELSDKQLHAALQDLRIHNFLKFLPKPRYSEEAVDGDVARLHSLLVSKGYFDAMVRPDDVAVHGRDATVRIRVEAGPLYHVRSVIGLEGAAGIAPARWSSGLCSCLFQARRAAERQGIIDFRARVDVNENDGHSADLVASVERGPVYRVHHIEFSGLSHYKDETVRRNVILEEGALLDEGLLRRSVARLNETMMFDPIGMPDVLIRSDEKTGTADIDIRLRERKSGGWLLSGPVGPASLAGPLEASLMTKLPPWGRGVFELSTYTVSLTAFAFMGPMAPALGLAKSTAVLPVLALRRPYAPGEGWLSGFTIAPQLGWKFGLLGYAATQLQRRTLPLLDGSRNAQPQLAIEFASPHSDGPLLCEPPKPRLRTVRRVGALGVELMGAFAAF